MQYGFMMGISPREPIRRFRDLCVQADELGYDVAWLADSQLITKNPYVAFALAAEATDRIRMGPGVANPVTYNWTALTSTMSAINELSDGRAVLGLGVGDSAVTPLGLKAARRSELAAVTRAIGDLASGDPASLDPDGEKVQMITANERFPILISASQTKMLQLGGRVADGVIVMGGADRELTAWQIDQVRQGAEESGRSLDDIEIDVWFAISISDDAERARNDVRAWATSQARWFSQWKELPESLQTYKEEFDTAYEHYDFSGHLSVHSEHSSLVSDEFVDLIAPSGSAAKVADHIAPLKDLKIDRITFPLLPGGREDRLQRTAKELMPRLE